MMAAVAAAGAAQLALAVFAVLNRIALVVGWTGLLCLAVVLVRLACAVRGDMRLARQRKRFPKQEPELGDDVLDTIALWHQAEFDEGLERLLTDEEKRRG